MNVTRTLLSLAALLVLAPPSLKAQTTFHSVEPNETKATATPAEHVRSGDVLALAQYGSAVNFFRVSTEPAPLGIYRHELRDGTGQLVGSDAQLGAVEPDSTALIQTVAFSEPLAWYGFGRAEEVFANIAPFDVTRGYGTASYVREPVTPIDIGVTMSPYNSVNVFITAQVPGAPSDDTSLQIFDEAFRPLPHGMSDDPGGFDSGANLSRYLRPGRYYVAVSVGHLATALPVSEYCPFELALLRAVTDDQGAVATDASAIGSNLVVNVYADGALPQTTVTLQDPYEVVWITFQVQGSALALDEYTFCEGADPGHACPCGTPPAGRLGGCPNSTGRGATIMLYEPWANSFTAPYFAVALYDLPPGAMALPFLGLSHTVDDLVGGGRLCLDPGAVRLDVLQADGAGKAEAPLANGTLDPNLFGSTYFLQAAYRDSAAAQGCRLNVTSGTAYRL